MTKFTLFLLLALFVACKTAPEPVNLKNKTTVRHEFKCRILRDPTPFVNSLNSFGLDFYKTLAAADTGNLVISPLSIYSMLAVNTVGTAGQTRDELVHALQCEINPNLLLDSLNWILETHKNDSIGEFLSNFVSATAVWPDKRATLVPEFVKTAKRNNIELHKIDFGNTESAERIIDQWASDKTNGKIEDIVNQTDLAGPVIVAVTNAVSAVGEWAWKFDKQKTKLRDFFLSDGSQIQVPMMNESDHYGRWTYWDFEDFALLSMPTSDTRLSFHVLLPDSGKNLSELERQLSTNAFKSWQDSVREPKASLHVFLPRFNIDRKFDLIPIISSFGVRAAFQQDLADFSNLLSGHFAKGNRISVLKHAAIVTVEEDGFEAHAVSFSAIPRGVKPGKPITFDANRPFFFTIMHNETGLILFCGRVMRPVIEDE